jgi:hypothetical protein
VSLRRFSRWGPIRSSSRRRRHCAYLYAHLPKRRNDDRDAANHWSAIAVNQLQRLVRARDHVRPGLGQQRLDPSQRSRVTRLIRVQPSECVVLSA